MQAAAKDPAEGVRLSDAVFDIAVVANAYVEDARSKGKEVAKEALPILRAGVSLQSGEYRRDRKKTDE